MKLRPKLLVIKKKKKFISSAVLNFLNYDFKCFKGLARLYTIHVKIGNGKYFHTQVTEFEYSLRDKIPSQLKKLTSFTFVNLNSTK